VGIPGTGPGLIARSLAFTLPAFALLVTLTTDAVAQGHAGAGLVGSEIEYRVAPRDTLTGIGARFGVEVPALAAANGLTGRSRIAAGQILRVDARHIAVSPTPDWGIVVNLPQRFLFYVEDGQLALAFPVAVGRPDWETPTGDFRIATRERHPVWVVPASIQQEMRRLHQRVLRRVPPGPKNPLGDYWMGLSGSGCGIHATNAPSSIYGFRTHGCIRLHPDDASRLFERTVVGLPVRIVYEPVLLAKTPEGAVWLEVHGDAYRTGQDPVARVRALALEAGIEGEIDWTLAEEVVAKREGSPRRIDRGASALHSE
jgi:L,D-transpeptidase ErfK/SrfK